MRFSVLGTLLVVAISAFASAELDGSSGIRGSDRDLGDLLEHRKLQDDQCGDCRSRSVANSRPSNFDTREEIFDQLSPSEYKSVVDYCISDEANLADRTKEKVNTAFQASNRNYIVFVQLFAPPKKEAIAYLDRMTDTAPKRYAIVTVNRGRSRPRDMMQYKIGPLVDGRLPSSGVTVKKLLEDNEIPWAMRGNYNDVTKFYDKAVHKEAYKLKKLFEFTTGGYCIGGEDCDGANNMRFIQFASLATTPTQRITSVHFLVSAKDKEFGPSCLLPVPISFQILEDPDKMPQNWVATNFEYCYQGPFDSAESLMTAIDANELYPCQMTGINNQQWIKTDTVTPHRGDADIKEPTSYHSRGKRYIIDSAADEEDDDRRVLQEDKYNGRLRFSDFLSPDANKNQEKQKSRNLRTVRGGGGNGTGHRVSWLGWSFHVSSDQMHGMILRNLSFKGERLAYEMSFQEFFASYSGMGSAGQTVYFDSNWEVGNYSPLELGLDCPEDSTLLPILIHDGDDSKISKNVMCIFEMPTGEPMWRHEMSKQNNRIAGIPRTLLKIRVVSTMGNYDYIPTITLMADGVMKVDVEMGGYLQAGYSLGSQGNNPEHPYFGTRLRDNMAGLLHDHVIGIKADLDVGGLENTLKAGKIKYGTYEEATGGKHTDKMWHAYNGVKYMDWETIDSERGISHTDYDSIVIESPTKNKWGANRSYEIIFEHSIGKQIFPEDHPLGAATKWQYSNVAVTLQKDHERYCSFPTNYQVGAAIKSYDLREFQKDQDNVIEQDLVFWIMFGLHHYPKAEDVPLVSNFGSGFVLKPRNMHDRAAFEDLPDNREQDHKSCIPHFA